MMYNSQIFGSDDLRTTASCDAFRTTVVHPWVINVQGGGTDVQNKRHSTFGQGCPDPIMIRVTGRPTARRISRDPDSTETVIQSTFNLRECTLRVSERYHRDTN